MLFHWVWYWHNGWEWLAPSIALSLAILLFIFRRRKLAFSAVLSTLVFFVFATAYVTSFWGTIEARGFGNFGHSTGDFLLWVSKGGVCIELDHGFAPAPNPSRHYLDLAFDRRPPNPEYPDNQLPAQRNWFKHAGARVSTGEMTDAEFGTWFKALLIVVPGWWLLVALSILPTVWFMRRLHNRYPPGQCRKCGYDLRAHVSGAKCPECGALIPPRPAGAPAVASAQSTPAPSNPPASQNK